MRTTRFVVVLIGHGSFDGENYRFNLPGDDLTDTDLARLFDELPAQDQLIINATSASGAVIERWAEAETRGDYGDQERR